MRSLPLSVLVTLALASVGCSSGGSKVVNPAGLTQTVTAAQQDTSTSRRERATTNAQGICMADRSQLPDWKTCEESCLDENREPLSDPPEICSQGCSCVVARADDDSTIYTSDIQHLGLGEGGVANMGYRFQYGSQLSPIYGQSGRVTPYGTGPFRFQTGLVPFQSRGFQQFGQQGLPQYCMGQRSSVTCNEQPIEFTHFINCQAMIGQMDRAQSYIEEGNIEEAQQIFYRIEKSSRVRGTPSIQSEASSILEELKNAGKSLVHGVSGAVTGRIRQVSGDWAYGIQNRMRGLATRYNQYSYAPPCDTGFSGGYQQQVGTSCVVCVSIYCQ